ncbi:MAG: hypothetical protein LBF08_03710, partial [Dysgonamonadaceae bacterium]|nr:hypothetical protein [Dysgonamonadaceae bacterium]
MKTKKFYFAKAIFLMILPLFFSFAVSAQGELPKHDISIYNFLGAQSVEIFGSTTDSKIDFAALDGTHNIILNNVTIDLEEGCPLTIGKFETFVNWQGEIKGNAVITLTLKGNNVLKTRGGKTPAIKVSPGATLIIDGDGTLTVESNGGAGILLDYKGIARLRHNASYPPYTVTGFQEYAGSIIVNNGTITATGGGEYAGIGDGLSRQTISYYYDDNIGFRDLEVGRIEALGYGYAKIPGNQGLLDVKDAEAASGGDVPFVTVGGNITFYGGKVIAKKGDNCTKGDIVRAGNNPDGRVEINGGDATKSDNIIPFPVNSEGKRLYRIQVSFKNMEKGIPLSKARFKQMDYGVAGMKTGDNFWFPEGDGYQPGEIEISALGVACRNDEDIPPITRDGRVIITVSDPNPGTHIPVRFKLAGEDADRFKINVTYGFTSIENGYHVSPGSGPIIMEVVGTYDDGTSPHQYIWEGTGLPGGQKYMVLRDNNMLSLNAWEPIDLTCTLSRYPTGIASISSQDVRVSLDGQNLSIASPVAERVTVYSVAGALLHRLEKPAGEASFAVASTASAQVLIVRGSSGWARKIIV